MMSGRRLALMCKLTLPVQHENAGPEELFSVYVPTNHIYVGDIFLLGKDDVIHTNLSVREGLGAQPLPAAIIHTPSARKSCSPLPQSVPTLLVLCKTTASLRPLMGIVALAEVVVSVGMALPRDLTALVRS